MSKPNSHLYNGTKGSIIDVIQSLPKNPDDLLSMGFVEITPAPMAANSHSRLFYDSNNNLKVRFDEGDVSTTGFSSVDHYHVYNPNSTSKLDYYLDENGLPCPKGSKQSHIIPK